MSDQPVIIIGADHGGFELKEQVKTWLSEWGYSVEDVGAHQHDPEDDYPPFAFAVAEKVAQLDQDGHLAVGILCCRSAGGVTVAANKVKGIRAVAVSSLEEAIHAKEHNNANVISLSGNWLSVEQAETVVKTFLTTPFTEEARHQRRIAQITNYETKHA